MGDIEIVKVVRRSPRVLKSPNHTTPVKSASGSVENGRILRHSARISSSAKSASSTANGGQKRPLPASSKTEKQSSEKKQKVSTVSKKEGRKLKNECFFVGKPIPMGKAQKRWPRRYENKGKGTETKPNAPIEDDEDDEELPLDVKCHYAEANIAGCILKLEDCVYVKGKNGGPNYIGRILEFFESMEGECYCSVQWFFKVEDTVMKDQADFHDKKRVFYSDLRNDNLLDCLITKVNIVQVRPSADLKKKGKHIPSCDFHFDMKYSVDYSTFTTMVNDHSGEASDLSSSSCIENTDVGGNRTKANLKEMPIDKSELALLDLYSGCGAMSTGLCLGAKLSGVNLVTKWAVDFDKFACESLKLNHPETQVWNEPAADFLELLKEWEKLCKRYLDDGRTRKTRASAAKVSKIDDSPANVSKAGNSSSEEYEVSSLRGICYGDPNKTGKRGLRFKVHWRGYGPSEDTWELVEGLRNCQDVLRDFVREGFKSKILPLPGDVDVICGGPPCQGISGLNRHRNVDAPLEDEKNQQIMVFMDIVKFLKPKYVLMENVVDILKMANGTLGRYALSRLIHMNYQASVGIMAAGCYGLPQFRLRAFLWGAHPYEKLPQYPLPTHDVVLRGFIPNEFKRCTVAYDEGQSCELEKALLLCDAISDLPPVTSHETRDKMSYGREPETDFQKFIRSTKSEMMGLTSSGIKKRQRSLLYDHLPLPLNEDDYARVCQIPREKGANFRDLPGIVVGADNTVRWDPNVKRILLPSGKPLIPDYAMSHLKGKSTKCFARLWWDETVPTVVTRAEPHNQPILHPVQDRVLTVRENARLQGFPDYYKLYGPIKERYRQIGNAVAVPVARALGYTLGLAMQKLGGDQPLMTLPPKFSCSAAILIHPSSSSDVAQ